MTFPCGLCQPGTGYRFSLDALLLAAYAQPRGRLGLDLGAGCGVVGLGMLLRHPALSMLAVELHAELVACAHANGGYLGVAERFFAIRADIRHLPIPAESVDFVVCNPPYRRPGTGRQNPDPCRSQARFETTARLTDFLQAARFAVRNRGRCWWVLLADRLDELLAGCLAQGLRPKRLLPVAPHAGAPARLVLLETVKNGGPGLTVLSPLVLHDTAGPRRFAASALQFCPWLDGVAHLS